MATFTRVDESYFEDPVSRLDVSGGSSLFFALKLTKTGKKYFGTKYGPKHDGSMISETHFIGKDLSRSTDEVNFYERALAIKKRIEDNDTGDDGGLGELLKYAFPYVGVVRLRETIDGETATMVREMLVLKNLRDSHNKVRLLDFKIGEKTADVNWRGKSRARAYKQQLLDGFTNSTREGFRLEGFDGQPDALASMDPLLDLKFDRTKDSKPLNEKKAARIALQRMSGSSVLMHYLDLHASVVNSVTFNNVNSSDVDIMVENLAIEIIDIAKDKEYQVYSYAKEERDLKERCLRVAVEVGKHTEVVDQTRNANLYTASEVSEITLHETVRQLAQLLSTCHSVSVPQKWLGSSVALGYDAGTLLPRSSDNEEKLQSNVIVSIFDWGRSELALPEDFDQLSSAEQRDRKTYWDYYMSGINNLSFNAAKRYYNQFSNSNGWDEITICVMDYDSASHDDFSGEVTISLLGIPLATTWSQEFDLSYARKWLHRKQKRRKPASIKLDISWWDAPDTSSCILGLWRITIDWASNLPVMDVLRSSSDPYCIVTARSGSFEFQQMTSVKIQTLHPVWGETIELPVVSCASKLSDSLLTTGLKVDPEKIEDIFGKGQTKEEILQSKLEWAKLFR